MGTKKLPPEVLEYFREQGLKGGRKDGLARAANLTPEQRSEIARKAVAAREAKRAIDKANADKDTKPTTKKAAWKGAKPAAKKTGKVSRGDG